MAEARPFTSVLVTNRGEIARRVIRAVREAGLRSIAVYSDADAGAAHVRDADAAVHIGPTPAVASYLSIEAIMRAAHRCGAEAIHPGYGFLSERADFARAVADAGLVFIGPSARVMDAMGRKDHARAIAERAGVPVTEQYDAATVPPAAYPVIVKAAAGGGGKGMRIVSTPAALEDALAAARREAAAAFGDDTLLVERYVEAGRHVEAQVIGDHHGSVLHLFERDCSVQRRHQKVIEEAPAPTISAAVRTQLLESSVALCREVGYVSAGTVEFLVSGEEIAFLEMNTRLQVEHPVTELVTGLDLVRLQLLVAAGEPLPLTQAEVMCTGHAFEARIYAEDPYAGFLPQAGRAHHVHWPADVRVDAALESGQEVTTAYDPMLGKIVVHGADRESARHALVAALDDTAVLGLTTNTGFVRELAASRAYADAQVHTGWLDSDPAAHDLLQAPSPPAGTAEIAARAWAARRVVVGDEPFGAADGWRLGGAPAELMVELVSGGEEISVALDRPIDDIAVAAVADAHAVTVAVHGQQWTYHRPDPMRPRAAATTADADVVSPMPGTVLAVNVANGARVAAGAVLGVVEAMKMELALTAPYDGTVTQVTVTVGEQVPLGQVLFRVDPDAAVPVEGP